MCVCVCVHIYLKSKQKSYDVTQGTSGILIHPNVGLHKEYGKLFRPWQVAAYSPLALATIIAPENVLSVSYTHLILYISVLC